MMQVRPVLSNARFPPPNCNNRLVDSYSINKWIRVEGFLTGN